MRPQIPIPVEMDQMARRVGNPDFGFPSDVRQIARKDGQADKDAVPPYARTLLAILMRQIMA